MSHDHRPRRSVRRALLFALLALAPVAAPAATAPPGATPPRSVTPSAPTADLVRPKAGDDRLLLMAAGIFDPVAERLDFASFGWRDARPGSYGIVQVHAGKGGAVELEALGLEVVGYLPNHAFQVRWDAESRAQVAGHTLVRWASDYPPGLKVSPGLWPGRTLHENERVNVVGFRRGQLPAVETTLLHEFPDVRLASRVTTSPQPQSRFKVPPALLAAFVARAAELEDVAWIEPWRLAQLHNDAAVPVIQNNSVTGTPIWDQDLVGAGQIVAVADSGLDRNQCWFTQHNDGVSTNNEITDAENVVPPALGTTWPQRKVFAYWVAPGASPYDDTQVCTTSPTSFHGTHTSGTVAGDRGTVATPTDPTFLGTDRDGMAPNAQILFQDIGNDATGCLAGTAGDIGLLFRQARDAGAHISSNSWGSATGGAYTATDQEADAAAWSLEDMLVVFSAGNSGPGGNTTGSPGNAKNVLTVGALGHGVDPAVAFFSSRGPTDDSRQKPDITAPGSSVVSAAGDDTDTGTQCPASGSTLSGTSMSAPTVAGGAALMREYYTEGFYPSGARTAADARAPSAALMKATLLNGTADVPTAMPSAASGWGRLHLDRNLYFASVSGHRRLRAWTRPNDAGLLTSQIDNYTLSVPSGAELRVTLAWMDPPPTLGAAVQLVNNLDLEVVGPGGTPTYRGNVFAAGQSTTGGLADNRNTVEQVRLLLPTAGDYTLRVGALAVPGNGEAYTQRQGYALVASYGGCAEGFSGAPANPVATDLGGGGIQVGFDAVSGATTYSVYRADGNCSAPAESFEMIGTTSGSPFTDTAVDGGFSYAYKVRAADGCAEGPLSTCVTASSTGSCSLVPTFDFTTTTASSDGSTAICDADLSWGAGTSNCPLDPAVTYNVYRSTQHSFLPGPANLYASAVSGTSFSDTSMSPLTTYFYVVRAQNGSAPPVEAPNTRRLKVVPTASTSSPGTFVDGADAPSYLQLDTPWVLTSQLAAAGTLSYHNANDNQNYLPDTCASVTTPDLQLAAGATLSYAARWNLEQQWDGVVVEISTNGGATWSDLPPSGGYPSNFGQTGSPPINACGYPASQGAFGGSSGGAFQTKTSSLAAFAGQTVRIRWRFSSDPGAEEPGFFLDSVSVTNAQVPDPCGVSSDLPFADGFESGTLGAWTGGVSP